MAKKYYYENGISMRFKGVKINKPKVEAIAIKLGISNSDVKVKHDVLTVFNTSQQCQVLIDNNSLYDNVALALDIPSDHIYFR